MICTPQRVYCAFCTWCQLPVTGPCQSIVATPRNAVQLVQVIGENVIMPFSSRLLQRLISTETIRLRSDQTAIKAGAGERQKGMGSGPLRLMMSSTVPV